MSCATTDCVLRCSRQHVCFLFSRDGFLVSGFRAGFSFSITLSGSPSNGDMAFQPNMNLSVGLPRSDATGDPDSSERFVPL